ncbi:MAG: asparagine synthase (glutamine-hydrolyzing) [Pseudomonadota bacterium]
MCGVFASLDSPASPASGTEIDAALASLARRGPDDKGFLHLPGCSLGHTRLAIVDPTGGQQPMSHPRTGLALSYNGEVYNAPELRAALRSKGHTFKTRSDTEVVLAAFAETGPTCVASFEGMFAFALWDPRQACLYLVRDRMGEKPLFYSETGDGRFVVASEIKALIAAGVDPRVDPFALEHYLQWKYPPPDRTIYGNIHLVPPAHVLTVRDGRIEKTCYWRLPCEGSAAPSFDEAVEETGRLLSEAVKNRLTGDRPVGLSLSGGIDSTLLGAFATEAKGMPISSYTLRYRSGLDEGPAALISAAALGLLHTEVPLKDPIPDDLADLTAYLDQPHADTANLAQSMLCARARNDVAVLLSGDGADELFYGYDWYSSPLKLAFRQERMTIFGTEERQALLSGDVSMSPDISDARPEKALTVNDVDFESYLRGQLLPKADLLGMMHGVEVRAPFLDHRLVEFARSLPPSLKTGRPPKPLLRSLLARTRPDLSMGPKKQGFGAPIGTWLSKPTFTAFVHDTLSSGAKIRGLLEPKALDRQLAACFSHPDRKNAYRIWLLLCLELWASSRPTGSAAVNHAATHHPSSLRD